MAANEIDERIAAAAWVQCGGGAGEAVNALDPAQIRYRSLVGFEQRIITTVDPSGMPVLILPLTQAYNRHECAVFATRLATCGPGSSFVDRSPYPRLDAPAISVPQAFVHPFLLEWMGPDLTVPSFFPFGIVNGVIPVAPPVGANLDLFDAIAVLLPVPVAAASSGDFCVLVVEHPPLEGTGTVLEADLPAPAPDVFALALAWWRGDTTTSGGDTLDSFNGLVGTEGDLIPLVPTNNPTPDPALNNQLAISSNQALESTMPAAFWDFLVTGPWTAYMVHYPVDAAVQSLLWTAANDLTLRSNPVDAESGDLTIELGAGGADGINALLYTTAALGIGQWTRLSVGQGFPPPPPLLRLGNTFAGIAEPNALTGGAPAMGATLRVLGEFPLDGDIGFAELIFWDFALSPAQETEVEAYLNARYATTSPAPFDILATSPAAWFRADTFTGGGAAALSLTGRVGTEGNLISTAPTLVPDPDPELKNQLSFLMTSNLVSDMPAAFWNFLASENFVFYAVCYPDDADQQRLITNATDDLAIISDPTGDAITFQFGPAGVSGSFALPWNASVGARQRLDMLIDAGEPSPVLVHAIPAGGENNGPFLLPPSGVMGSTLQIGNFPADTGVLRIAELIFYDRGAADPPPTEVVIAYFTARYGSF